MAQGSIAGEMDHGLPVAAAAAPPRILSPALARRLQAVVIVPTYLYVLLGPQGLMDGHDPGPRALLWTGVVGALAIYPQALRVWTTGLPRQTLFIVGYLALSGWAAWLASLNGSSAFLFYLVVGAAASLDPRLGRAAAIGSALVVFGEAYFRWGAGDLGPYSGLLAWVAGLLFTLAVITLARREQQARQRSESLLAELQGAHRQLQEYAAQVRELAAAQERNRLAAELHDSVTQTLFSAGLIADVLPRLWEQRPQVARERLRELRDLNRGALAEMRLLLMELRPAALTQAALGDLLRMLAGALAGRSHLPIEVEVVGQVSLPPEVQVELYRIAQEALNNVVKYAGAGRVRIGLRGEPGLVTLRVEDNGKGFDPAAVPGGHFGLSIMRERAEAIGATLRIDSAPGQGTTVSVSWKGGEDGPAGPDPGADS